ncbi:hypothetical protein [Pectinatus haikarae]|uniref:Uncharacterized protein n=1 Tax=Pectinatus haikarae TaxID=349096 RepID=A0ABT9Y6U4_9FIRM|nr:hypothetical protein [Pectinatus haikarae]MDQ0203368.1 hypothetical protein [Pectinatus haikarae]
MNMLSRQYMVAFSQDVSWGKHQNSDHAGDDSDVSASIIISTEGVRY